MSNGIATVLIPARDEADAIEGCLQRVLAQTADAARLEVIVVDGGSRDDTAARAEAVLAGSPLGSWRVLSNPTGSTPSNLNVGLAAASGDTLCRVDARSLLPPTYVERCESVLWTRPDVVVVGGSQVAVARTSADTDIGIARALNNRYGMGLARYRRGAASGPTDTVYLGAFRTEQLRAAGGWDESWSTNQDFELNRRMARAGTIWFEEDLEVGYLPRRDLVSLWRQYERFGRWKVRYWQTTGDRPQRRQLVLLLGPPVAVGLAPLVWRRLGRSGRVLLTSAAIGGAVTIEVTGPSGPAGGMRSHLVSGVASGVVAAAWTAGVWAEATRGAGVGHEREGAERGAGARG